MMKLRRINEKAGIQQMIWRTSDGDGDGVCTTSCTHKYYSPPSLLFPWTSPNTTLPLPLPFTLHLLQVADRPSKNTVSVGGAVLVVSSELEESQRLRGKYVQHLPFTAAVALKYRCWCFKHVLQCVMPCHVIPVHVCTPHLIPNYDPLTIHRQHGRWGWRASEQGQHRQTHP